MATIPNRFQEALSGIFVPGVNSGDGNRNMSMLAIKTLEQGEVVMDSDRSWRNDVSWNTGVDCQVDADGVGGLYVVDRVGLDRLADNSGIVVWLGGYGRTREALRKLNLLLPDDNCWNWDIHDDTQLAIAKISIANAAWDILKT